MSGVDQELIRSARVYRASAFPLSPVDEDDIDERGFARLVARLAGARVDSIGALGSTGAYPYLSREKRARATRVAVDAADDVPVMVGIGALRTSEVRVLAEDAQRAGAAAVLSVDHPGSSGR